MNRLSHWFSSHYDRLQEKSYRHAFRTSRFFRKKILRKIPNRFFFASIIVMKAVEIVIGVTLLLLFVSNVDDISDYDYPAIIVWGIFLALMYVYKKTPIRIEQKMRRDLQARNIYQSLKSGNPKPFVFYIRRFFADTGMAVVLDAPWYKNLSPTEGNRPLEQYIADSAPKHLPVIKIGGQRLSQDFGVGTRYYEQEREHQTEAEKECIRESWFSAFKEFAKASERIIILPLVQSDSALLDEIEWLKQHNLLSKVIFIMPPKAKAKFYDLKTGHIKDTQSISDIWAESKRTIQKKLGITIPDYSSKGGFFQFDQNHTALMTTPSGRSWKSKGALRDMLKGKIELSSAEAALQFGLRQLYAIPNLIMFMFISIFILNEADFGDVDTNIVRIFLISVAAYIFVMLRNLYLSFNKIGFVLGAVAVGTFYYVFNDHSPIHLDEISGFANFVLIISVLVVIPAIISYPLYKLFPRTLKLN